MGTEWDNQQLGVSLDEFLLQVQEGVRRQLAETGEIRPELFDHNSPSYAKWGISNKRIRIAARWLLTREISQEEAWKIVVKAAFGGQ